MKLISFLLAVFVVTSGYAQALQLTGENYLILNGERFKNQKIVFTKADGDWFATTDDSHGTIGFDAVYSGRNMRLDIEWDGMGEAHVITDEIRHQSRKGEFILSLPDKAVYGDGVNAYPVGEQEVRIMVRKVDDASVSGELSGMITQGNEQVRISGSFNLRKTAPSPSSKKIVTAVYKNYDNVVHDKLIGAEERSPSESEARYDIDTRMAIHDAFAPVLSTLEKEGWKIEEQSNLDPLDGVGRGSEKRIFNTTYDIKLSVTPASPVFANYQKRVNDLSAKTGSNPTKENFEEFKKLGHEMSGATQITINVSVNSESASISNFNGGAKVTKLADNFFKIQSAYVQARTGGGADAAKDATVLLIGKWKQPVIQKPGDGVEEVNASPIFSPSVSHLAAQNIMIRIECNQALADEIIKTLDMEKLRSLFATSLP